MLCGSLSPWHDRLGPWVVDGDDLQVWRLSVNVLNKQSWTADGVVLHLVGEGLTTPHCKRPAYYKMLHRGLNFDRFFVIT